MSSITNNEDEDEVKRYSKSNDRSTTTIIAVLEGDYVRFALELDNGKIAEEKIVSQEEFEKMIKQEGWIKQQE